MERQRHWWNGRFANLGRRDVFLWIDQGQWRVEASRGSLARRCRHFSFDSEMSALVMVDVLTGSQGDGWRELRI
jgi:hypothetical protein